MIVKIRVNACGHFKIRTRPRFVLRAGFDLSFMLPTVCSGCVMDTNHLDLWLASGIRAYSCSWWRGMQTLSYMFQILYSFIYCRMRNFVV